MNLTPASSIALLGLTAWSAPAAAPVFPPLAKALRIQSTLRGAAGIALTFDDGPHPEGTPAILEILARAGARATFFLVGEQVTRWPDVASAIADAGHEIASHGHKHVLQLRRMPGQLRDDLRRGADAIEEATGRVPRYYRPPYGVFSSPGLAIAKREGCVPLLWSRWGRDWAAHATPIGIARAVTKGLVGGDVVLLHDSDAYSSEASWRKTALALPSIIEAAARTGAPLISVSQSR